MTPTWLPSPNLTPGRGGAQITDIVLHWMDGTLANTDAEFTGGSRGVSAHYGVEDDVVHQYVRDVDTAWHAGDWAENCRSIGIEHSAQPGRDASLKTIATSIALIVGLSRKYNISPDHIWPHNKFYATACPGTLPIATMIDAVRAQIVHGANPATKLEDTMKPFFIHRRSDGFIAIVTASGVRHVTASHWQVWRNLGYTPLYANMDDGPFAAIIEDLGGLK